MLLLGFVHLGRGAQGNATHDEVCLCCRDRGVGSVEIMVKCSVVCFVSDIKNNAISQSEGTKWTQEEIGDDFLFW